MNDEEFLAIDSIRKALINEPPYSLTRVLNEYGSGTGWALFRMDNNNGTYDDALPMWNENNDHGRFYAFFWTVPQTGSAFAIRQKCTYSKMRFFESDAAAVRWALVAAENLESEYKQQKAVEDEISKREEVPF